MVFGSFFMFANSYRLDGHYETCVALLSLKLTINQNRVGNWTFLCLVMVIKSVSLLVFKSNKVEASVSDKTKRVCICLGGVIAREFYFIFPCKEKQILRESMVKIKLFHDFGNFYKLLKR